MAARSAHVYVCGSLLVFIDSIAIDYKKKADDARNHSADARKHSDAARLSSGEHSCELGRMQENAIDAARDTADRTAHRKR